jgi:hypothetical protein
MWWFWKVIYAWIKKYFKILCKSIDYIQSNKEILGEDEWDMCGREDPTLVVKHGFSFNPRSHGKIQAHEKKINNI